MDRAADSGPCDPSSIPLGEKKENKRKEAGVGPFKKKKVLFHGCPIFELRF